MTPPYMPWRPESCVWELTRRCNMACLHCGSRAGAQSGRELSRREALSAADQLLELGCRRVTLIGGEVTLYPWWRDVVRRLVRGGAVCDIVTNGYGKTARELAALANVGLTSAALSIDGYGETHNRLRGRSDAFQEAERFCRELRRRGLPLTAVTTLTRPCLEDLDRLCSWLLEQGIRVWQWQQVSPMGRAADRTDLCLTREDVRWVLEQYPRLRERLPILLADNLGYYYAARSGETLQAFQGCAAGLRILGLDSEGNVRGCESLYDPRFIEGNLRERTLRAIWMDPDAFAYNRRFCPSDLTGRCADCPHGAICAGGCRSFNAFHGALYESVNCAWEPAKENEIQSAHASEMTEGPE